MVADYVYKAIDALPITAHPMTQFTTGVMALQVGKWACFSYKYISYFTFSFWHNHCLVETIWCVLFMHLDLHFLVGYPNCLYQNSQASR